jgi:hypothetical protein
LQVFKSHLQDSSQFGVAVWNARGTIVQGIDDLAEHKERLVDTARLDHSIFVVALNKQVRTMANADANRFFDYPQTPQDQ